MTSLCRLQRAGALTWNAEPIPADLVLSLGSASVVDPAVCLFTSADLADDKLEFSAVRYAQDSTAPYPIQFVKMVSMTLSGHPIDVTWHKAHQMEGFRSKHPMGLITIVTSDNVVSVYDPRFILKGFQATTASNAAAATSGVNCNSNYGLVCKYSHEGTGRLTTVDLDRCSSNLMACGDNNGCVCFVDLDNSQLGSVVVETAQGAVTVLKWHPLSKDVLLAGSQQGVTVLNSKSRKPLITIVAPSKHQNVSGLCWLETGKSVAVVYNDTSRPTGSAGILQIFDLRHTAYPIKEFQHLHQEAIVGLEQSTMDPRFFTTASRDGKCITWVMNGPSVLPYAETSLDESIISFGISKSAGLSCVSMHTANDSVVVLPREPKLLPEAAQLKFAPSWLPSGNAVDFGFGGKVAWFGRSAQDDIGGVSNVCCDDMFISTVGQFNPFFEADDLGGFCAYKRQGSGGPDSHEYQLWAVLEAAFLPLEHRAERLLSLLGFNAETISAQMESFLGHVAGASLLGAPEATAATGDAVEPTARAFGDGDTQHDTENFFNRLAHENSVEPTDAVTGTTVDESKTHTPGDVDVSLPAAGDGYFVSTGSTQWQREPLKLLKEAFIVGSPLGAIEMALAAKQFGVAFMLASSLNDATVLAMVKQNFLEFNRDPFVATMARASDQNFREIVTLGDLESWREIAAMLVTYPYRAEIATMGTHNEFTELCRLLGTRLHQSQGDVHSAILVYLIAGAYQEASELIGTMPSSGSGGQALKLLIIESRCPGLQMDPCAMNVLNRFVCRLVNAGMLQLATAVLSAIDGSGSAATAQLKYLIAESTSQSLMSEQKPIGFEVHDVATSPILAQQQQQYYPQQQQQQQPQAYTMSPQVAYNQPSPFGYQPPQQTNAPNRPPSFNSGATATNSFAPNNTGGGFQPFNNQPQSSSAYAPQLGFNASGGFNNAPPPSGGFNTQPPQTTGGGFNAPPPSGTFNAPPSHGGFNAPPPTGGFNTAPPQTNFNAPVPPQTNFNTNFGAPPQSPYPPGVISTPPPSNMSFNPQPQTRPDFPPPPMSGGFQPTAAVSHQVGAPPVTTHPAAGVSHLQPGMPTPWPIPTTTQQVNLPPRQVGSRTSTNEKLNQQVQQATTPAGVACPPGDLMKVRQTIETQIATAMRNGEDAKRTDEARRTLTELVQQLESSQVTKDVQVKLMEYVNCIAKHDNQAALAACQAMVSTGWSKNSKGWLNTLKRLTTRSATAPAQAVAATPQGYPQRTFM